MKKLMRWMTNRCTKCGKELIKCGYYDGLHQTIFGRTYGVIKTYKICPDCESS